MCAESDQIAANKPLIRKLINPYLRNFPNIPTEEFIQAGQIAFLRAIRNADPTKGAVNTLFGFYIRDECDAVIAAHTEVHLTATGKSKGAVISVISLDVPLNNDPDNSTGRDLLSDDSPTPEESCAAQDERNKIRAALAVLADKPRQMLETYFGLRGNPDGVTYDAVGEQYGMTKVGARLSVETSLKKLRPVLAARGLG